MFNFFFAKYFSTISPQVNFSSNKIPLTSNLSEISLKKFFFQLISEKFLN